MTPIDTSKEHRIEYEASFDLIEFGIITAIAQTCDEGVEKYGLDNWKRGCVSDQKFTDDIPNHVVKHVYQYLMGDRTENHIGHAAWGLMAMLWIEEQLADTKEGEIPPIKIPRWYRRSRLKGQATR